MKNLEQIKNDFAISKNFTDWDDLVYDLGYNSPSRLLLIIDQVMKIYAMECLKLASLNVDHKYTFLYNSVKNVGDEVAKQITNENNIIK